MRRADHEQRNRDSIPVGLDLVRPNNDRESARNPHCEYIQKSNTMHTPHDKSET